MNVGRDLARLILPADEAPRSIGWELATVTDLSPLDVELADGTVVEAIPQLRSAAIHGVGDVVVVRRVGTSRLVFGVVDSLGPPLVHIEGSTSVNNATNTSLEWTAGEEQVDSHGWANDATERIVPDVPGFYRVSCWASPGTNGATRAILELRKNNVKFGGMDVAVDSAGTVDLTATQIVELDGDTDYISFVVWHNSGAARTFTWAGSVELVRPT